MPSRDRSRAAPRAAIAIAVMTGLWAAFGGCRQILSIEDKEYDPALDPDAGADAAGEPSCDAYCTLIQSVCGADTNKQYASKEACMGLCSTFQVGTLDDTKKNTLGCRMRVLETSKAMIEDSDCAAAGPGGDGTCGSNCDSLCASMQVVCPASFESVGDCTAACTPLLDCGTYHVLASTPNDSTVQCRLYHISAAALGLDTADGGDTTSQTKHCPHAAGETECLYDADAGCP